MEISRQIGEELRAGIFPRLRRAEMRVFEPGPAEGFEWIVPLDKEY